MESIYTELALYGSKNECARNDTVFLPVSEVCDGTVSLKELTVVTVLTLGRFVTEINEMTVVILATVVRVVTVVKK